MVGREQPACDRRRPVDVEEVAPELGGRLRARREGLDHLGSAGRNAAFEFEVEAIDRVSDDGAVELEHDEPLRVRLLLRRNAEYALLPPRRRAREDAGTLPAHLLPDGREKLRGFLGRHEAHVTATLERPRERRPLARQLDRAAPRGEPVAEAAVDRLLTRPERRDRLATFVDVA